MTTIILLTVLSDTLISTSICVGLKNSVRTEEWVEPFLYLSNSKSYQHDGLINSLLIGQNPYHCQQSIPDNELIVDKVVLINKEPYHPSPCCSCHPHRFCFPGSHFRLARPPHPQVPPVYVVAVRSHRNIQNQWSRRQFWSTNVHRDDHFIFFN